MTKERKIVFCEKVLQQASGDYQKALEAIRNASDAAFALGDMLHAEQLDNLATFFVQYFNF
jgi:hypothetical protein